MIARFAALERYGCDLIVNNYSLCVGTAVAKHELVPRICSGTEKVQLVINKGVLLAFRWP
jgi:hypothetical protein